MNKPLHADRRGWGNQYHLFATESFRAIPVKLTIQKLVDGKWVTTGRAHDLEAARRHAEAVGGHVRVLNKLGDIELEVIESMAPLELELEPE
jgi:hypothetical protein